MRYYSHPRAFAQAFCIISTSFIFHNSALANPAQRRAETTCEPSLLLKPHLVHLPSRLLSIAHPLTLSYLSAASITSSSSGSASAAITTLSGTVDPDLVPSTISSAAPSASATNGASTLPDITFPRCTTGEVQEAYRPFCLPVNGTDKYPGNSYYG